MDSKNEIEIARILVGSVILRDLHASQIKALVNVCDDRRLAKVGFFTKEPRGNKDGRALKGALWLQFSANSEHRVWIDPDGQVSGWDDEQSDQPSYSETLKRLQAAMIRGRAARSASPNRDLIPISDSRRKKKRSPGDTKGYVYAIQGLEEARRWTKLGCTRDGASYRWLEINPKLPFECEVVWSLKTANRFRAEKELHSVFASKHVRGEWYALNEADLVKLNQIAEL